MSIETKEITLTPEVVDALRDLDADLRGVVLGAVYDYVSKGNPPDAGYLGSAMVTIARLVCLSVDRERDY